MGPEPLYCKYCKTIMFIKSPKHYAHTKETFEHEHGDCSPVRYIYKVSISGITLGGGELYEGQN